MKAVRSEIVTWLRWMWRQLTSMRVALLLLLLLAVAAIPGSLVPQRAHDPGGVARIMTDSPALGLWLDRFGLFNVFGSPWFMAIYTLLFVSLVGCIVPRVKLHIRAVRADPPAVPRKLTRFPERRFVPLRTGVTAEQVYAKVRTAMGRRYRVKVSDAGLSAERGYVRETGNIVFHLGLLGVLISFGWGQLVAYGAQVVVVEENSFANSVVDFDSYEPGGLVDPSRLQPFTLRLDALDSQFSATGRPEGFQADVTLTLPGEPPRTVAIRPNEPLRVGGTSMFLSGNGYAPRIEVHDSEGNLAFSGPVPFLPQDDSYTSNGVIKVPDVTTGDQLGFEGQLLPTALDDGDRLMSVHPDLNNPLILLQVWRGDLGLDSGVPQNVYRLDTENMTQVLGDDGEPLLIGLTPGDTVTLPDGLGTISLGEIPRFGSIDVRHDPTLGWLLWTTVVAMLGMMVSLFTPRRRVWIRCVDTPGGAMVEAAALARGEDAGLRAELDNIMGSLSSDIERTSA